MKNNQVILKSLYGQQLEGIIADTSKPGTCMEIDPAVAFISGRPSYIALNDGTAGYSSSDMILVEDDAQGFPIGTAYVAGRMGRLWCPLPGDELNVLPGEASGTGHSFAIGDYLMHSASLGEYIPWTAANSVRMVAMEAVHIAGQTALLYVQKA